MPTKTFEAYFASKGALSGGVPIAGDEALILRSGTVFRSTPVLNYGLASMNANATPTVIAAVDTFTSLLGTMADVDSTATLTFATNQYTYVGANQLRSITLRGSVSLIKAAAGVTDYELGLFINGTQVGTGMRCSSENDEPAFVACVHLPTLQTNDVIDMRIANRTDDTDVTIVDAQLEIGT